VLASTRGYDLHTNPRGFWIGGIPIGVANVAPIVSVGCYKLVAVNGQCSLRVHVALRLIVQKNPKVPVVVHSSSIAGMGKEISVGATYVVAKGLHDIRNVKCPAKIDRIGYVQAVAWQCRHGLPRFSPRSGLALGQHLPRVGSDTCQYFVGAI